MDPKAKVKSPGKQKKGKSKRKRIQFHKLAVNPNDTLAVGDIRMVVRKPEEEILTDWLTMNTVDIYQEIGLLYGVLGEYCTKDNCPSMTAGKRFEYLWADGDKYVQPVKLSAPAYVENLMNWVEKCLEPYKKKPGKGLAEFTKDKKWRKTYKNIFKRLFRVYAHIYHSHIKTVEELGIQKHLNTSFKRFVHFVDEFSLISIVHMEPLADLVRKMLAKVGSKQF